MTLWDTASVSLGQVRLAVREDLGVHVVDELEDGWRSGHVSAQKLVVAESTNALLKPHESDNSQKHVYTM